MEFKKNVIYQVNYALIAEYPDNANIFSMDGIDEYAKDVSDLGFYGCDCMQISKRYKQT